MAVRRYEQQRGDNVVFGPDLGWRIDDRWRLRAQWLHARSTALPDGRGVLQRAAAADGDRLYLELKRNGDLRESEVIVQDIGAGFRHDGGFVNQAGVRKLSLFQSQGWQAVGPFHEFWLNIKATRSQARDDGRTVEQQIIPGLYTTAAHNLEWWLELHPVAQLRASHDGPLLPQRYLSSGLVFSPATWFPLLDTSIDIGRLADTHDERLRSGLRWNTTAKLRPLAALELEPSLSSSWLRGDGQRAYDEQIANLLAVWHLGPRSHLRAIVQRTGHNIDPTQLTFRSGDSLLACLPCRTVDHLILLDTKGRAYSIPASDIPGGKGDGVPATSLADFVVGGKSCLALAVQPERLYLVAASGGYGFRWRRSSL